MKDTSTDGKYKLRNEDTIMITFLLAVSLHYAEPVVIEYPKQPAPVCIEYCTDKGGN